VKKNKPKYKWPTLQDRLNQRPISRVEALRQLQTTMPLSESAQRDLLQGGERKPEKNK
jgi:hypothetical protein